MLSMENIYRRPIVQRILIGRRRNRARFLLSKVRRRPGMLVLDVGCGTDGNSLESELPADCTIIGIDLLDSTEVHIHHSRFQYFKQDARDLRRFADKQFDLAVSVGMMEHVCDRTVLQQIASEMERVAQQYVVVVPWKYAWIEPHFKLPFFQLLPYWLQRELTKLLNLQNYAAFAREKPGQFGQHFRQHYQWLSSNEWQHIFKGSCVYLNPTLESISIVKN
jgi:cyclopropane fatty-acyl-phospholipid synthase-like methyltransferase